MSVFARGKRADDSAGSAGDKARKAEKARLKAEEAAQKAREAAEEAERAAEEAEAAESASEGAEAAEKPAVKAKTAKAAKPKPAKPAVAAETVVEPEPEPEVDEDAEGVADEDTPDEIVPDAEAPETEVDGEAKPVLAKKGAAKKPVLEKAAVEDDTDDTDEEDEQDEDEDGDTPVAERRRSLRSVRPMVYVLIAVNLVLAGALAAVLIVAGGMPSSTGDDAEDAKGVAFAASRAAEDLSSYDYRTIDADLKRATGHTTGKFKTQFEQQLGQVKPSATQQQAVVEGSAVKTAVESVDGKKAIALVYLNQQTAKGSSGQRTPNQYTLRMVMNKVGDRWLVSDLQMI